MASYWKVRVYVRANGNCPFDDWKLTNEIRNESARIKAKIAIIQLVDATQVMPVMYVEKYRNSNLWEMKFQGSKLRALCLLDLATKEITVLNGACKAGGGKGKGRIPQGDIDAAENLRNEILNGQGTFKDG